MKLRKICERVDPKVKLGLKKLGYHKNSSHEVGLMGGKKTMGIKDKVNIKFDPNDAAIKNEYMFHTHPTNKGENPLRSLPSEKDLQTAYELYKDGMKGIVIRHGKYYTVIRPTDHAEKFNPARYTKARKTGDFQAALDTLKPTYNIEHGSMDEV